MVMMIFFADGVVFPLVTISGTGSLIRSFIRNYGNPILGTPPIDLDVPPPGMLQAKYRAQFELPSINFARLVSYVMKSFIMAVFFMPVFPVTVLLAGITLTIKYWAFKYQLLRLSKRPYMQSYEVGYGALRFVLIGAAILASMQHYLLEPSLCGRGESFSKTVSILFLWPPLFLALLPLGSIQSFAAVCGCCIRDQVHTDTNYYNAQVAWSKDDKYHTSHPAYKVFEQIMRRAALKRPEISRPAWCSWDFKTGNFLDPSANPTAFPATPVTPVMIADAAQDQVTDSLEGIIEEMGEEKHQVGKQLTGKTLVALAAANKFKRKLVKNPVPSSAGDPDDVPYVPLPDLEDKRPGSHPRPLKNFALRSGMRVRIHGLVGPHAATINSTEAELLDWDAEQQKWTIVLHDGLRAKLETKHLEPVSVPA